MTLSNMVQSIRLMIPKFWLLSVSWLPKSLLSYVRGSKSSAVSFFRSSKVLSFAYALF